MNKSMSKLTKVLICVILVWVCFLTWSQFRHDCSQDDRTHAFAMVDGVSVYMVDVTYVPVTDVPEFIVTKMAERFPQIAASDVDWIIWRSRESAR